MQEAQIDRLRECLVAAGIEVPVDVCARKALGGGGGGEEEKENEIDELLDHQINCFENAKPSDISASAVPEESKQQMNEPRKSKGV